MANQNDHLAPTPIEKNILNADLAINTHPVDIAKSPPPLLMQIALEKEKKRTTKMGMKYIYTKQAYGI